MNHHHIEKKREEKKRQRKNEEQREEKNHLPSHSRAIVACKDAQRNTPLLLALLQNSRQGQNGVKIVRRVPSRQEDRKRGLQTLNSKRMKKAKQKNKHNETCSSGSAGHAAVTSAEDTGEGAVGRRGNSRYRNRHTAKRSPVRKSRCRVALLIAGGLQLVVSSTKAYRILDAVSRL